MSTKQHINENNTENENINENISDKINSKLNHSLSKLSVKDIDENGNENVIDNSDISNNKVFSYSTIINKYNENENYHKQFKMKKQLYNFTKREISGYRTGMGEYIPTNNTLPLTNFAIPTPGPSDYYCNSGKSGYEYTMLGRPQEKNNSIGPGPASANTRLKEKYPYWTIGEKLYYPKNQFDNGVPGPYYSLPDIQFDGQKVTLKSRHYTKREIQPSPSDYNCRKETPDGPYYSFGRKYQKTIQDNPGVGEYSVLYDYLSTLKQSPKYSFHSKPGIGLFDDAAINMGTPGANKYNIKEKPSNIYASIKGKYKDDRGNGNPAPNNFEIPSSILNQNNFTFTGKPLNEYEKKADEPGPVNYKPQYNEILRKSPMYSFGKADRSNNKTISNKPGPIHDVTYENIAYNTIPKITIKGKAKVKIPKTPGPSDYFKDLMNIPIKLEKIRRTPKIQKYFGSGRKEPKKVPPTPGPGSYDNDKIIKYQSSPTYSMGKKLNGKTNTCHTEFNYTISEKPKEGIKFKGRMSNYVLTFPSNRINIIKSKV
ncbi:hypothetical protein BCR32DRAFT_264308 [Anaeromyces robustus]|uniref:Uncharacterized protein n=1 Tax=Anaeromyces robustus TaxID=1754192 RepID=A0A1Y1XNQ6_9FUNG|nr:hypothetical protein BCR32DRAFT_264308 [Anaeromyces robustus]|eukprot:ORX87390.1 hypothetical protein BCR32DRAFT_264308 [Anaeromyces robustus]